MNTKETLSLAYAEALRDFTESAKALQAALEGNDPAEDKVNPIVLNAAKRVLRARVSLLRTSADLQEWTLDNEEVPNADIPDFLPDSF